MTTPDITHFNNRTVHGLSPNTPEAKEWLLTKLYDPYVLDGTVLIEHRYIEAVVDGLQREGFTVGPPDPATVP